MIHLVHHYLDLVSHLKYKLQLLNLLQVLRISYKT